MLPNTDYVYSVCVGVGIIEILLHLLHIYFSFCELPVLILVMLYYVIFEQNHK